MLVVVFHFAGADRGVWVTPTRVLFAGPLFQFASYGWLGVELFFMISGFVICMSTWGKKLSDFAISRVVRLFPAYWIGIVLTTAILAADRSFYPALPWRQILVNMTMTEEYVHVTWVDPSYWTLIVELSFYGLIAFLLVGRGLTYRRVVGFCIGYLTVSMLTIWLRWWLTDLILQPDYTPFFIGGVILYLIYRFGPSRSRWALLAVDWLCAMYRLISRTDAQARPGWHLHYWIAALIITGFFVLLAFVALGKLTRIRGRWLTIAGGLTYPVYLLHQQIGETLIRSMRSWMPAPILVIVATVAIVGLSWIVYRYLEPPLARAVRNGLLWLRRTLRFSRKPADGQRIPEPRQGSPIS